MSPRRVLITGASKGIGRAVADRVAAAGHLPIGLARTRPEDFPGEFFEVDLADRAATADVLEGSSRAGGSMPWSTMSASRGSAESGRSSWTICSTTYDLNVRTAVQVVQAALPGMLAAGWGRIVNVTSLTTLGTPERTPYAASKAALEAATRIWADELAPTGITVNAVAPGPTETEMYRERSPIGSEREARFWKRFRCTGSEHRGRSRMRSSPAGRGRRLHHRPDHSAPTAAGASLHDTRGTALRRPTGRPFGGAVPAVRRFRRHLCGRRGSADAAGRVLPAIPGDHWSPGPSSHRGRGVADERRRSADRARRHAC